MQYLHGAAGVFSESYFKWWVALSVIWGLVGAGICIFMPLIESRTIILRVCPARHRHCSLPSRLAFTAFWVLFVRRRTSWPCRPCGIRGHAAQAGHVGHVAFVVMLLKSIA